MWMEGRSVASSLTEQIYYFESFSFLFQISKTSRQTITYAHYTGGRASLLLRKRRGGLTLRARTLLDLWVTASVHILLCPPHPSLRRA
jgi:hypothetical protein